MTVEKGGIDQLKESDERGGGMRIIRRKMREKEARRDRINFLWGI